ncbi:hypothetical protein [Achromobacter sp.]|uniref:hypothetical protein n=1 Tax=Achromobacter sp. TaxID=134375 RepID=UPI000ED2D1DF|nr:hypothetical protein [Achromobacter sp.]HCW18802.1 hypothetical protein [Achromobacter sp.]
MEGNQRRQTLILCTTRAHAAYSAMCALNGLHMVKLNSVVPINHLADIRITANVEGALVPRRSGLEGRN